MKDYHDYVIKDGLLIGKFNEMYLDCENPWHQTDGEMINSLYRDCAIRVMNDLNVSSIIEFGCGLGTYTNKLCNELDITVTGVDISSEAIRKAKNKYSPSPHKESSRNKLDFITDSVLNIDRYPNFDCYLFADVMWYILDDLDAILKKMKNCLKGKYFINNMPFYKGTQKYGLDKFTNIQEFIDYIPFEYMGYIVVDMHYVRDTAMETVSWFKI